MEPFPKWAGTPKSSMSKVTPSFSKPPYLAKWCNIWLCAMTTRQTTGSTSRAFLLWVRSRLCTQKLILNKAGAAETFHLTFGGWFPKNTDYPIAELFKTDLILQQPQHWGLFDMCSKGCWKGLSTSRDTLGMCEATYFNIQFPTIHGLVWSSKASSSALRVDSDINGSPASPVNQHAFHKNVGLFGIG